MSLGNTNIPPRPAPHPTPALSLCWDQAAVNADGRQHAADAMFFRDPGKLFPSL